MRRSNQESDSGYEMQVGQGQDSQTYRHHLVLGLLGACSSEPEPVGSSHQLPFLCSSLLERGAWGRVGEDHWATQQLGQTLCQKIKTGLGGSLRGKSWVRSPDCKPKQTTQTAKQKPQETALTGKDVLTHAGTEMSLDRT